ncbi:hypothetical protein GGX14DRAFT_638136 [Mycena pura]|uniref:Mating-type protein C-terminal domain-containing protein n=1 Tax=Mycena pura TaxID=153505 RepID=A0AAD6YP49_9AGAR|nr:hypothetical protein GGX14DRAFT_638136 [Mycena pura]
MASSSKFIYDTVFPEQGLAQAMLHIVRPCIEEEKKIIGTESDNGLAATLHEVTLVAKVLYHFGVDEDDIPARMEDMGMLEFYERMIAAGCCEERVSEWFVDVRRRIGWTRLLRKEFDGRRADMVEVAARLHPGSPQPLPLDIQAGFSEIEATAHEIYGHKFIPSAVSNSILVADKSLTPELEEQVRLEEVRTANVYPSPAPSGSSSPISGPGDTDLFEPGSLLVITFFDPVDYIPEDDEHHAASLPITQMTTLQAPTESDMITFDIPGLAPEIHQFFDSCAFVSSLPI